MKAKNDLSADYVRSILAYDPLSGELRWIKTVSQRSIAGAIAGHREIDGRIRLRIGGRIYIASRLIWLIVTGEWPPFEIDHRDLDKSNNRWLNLRPATRSQNCFNKTVRKDNVSGLKGVSFNRTSGRYNAELWANGRYFWLGRFKTAEEAWAARCAAAMREHGEFARMR